MYSSFSSFYDSLTANVDYGARADCFLHLTKLYSGVKSGIALDLCCGTGGLTRELGKRGFDTIGVDNSPEMLSAANMNCSSLNPSPLFLLQDIAKLDLYGTVDCAFSCLDGLNHLPPAQLPRFFSRLCLFLNTGGVFVFDINTSYKHEAVLSGKTFVYEPEGLFCVWQNSECENGRVDMRLDFFTGQKNGLYRREFDEFSEWALSPKAVLEAAGEYGFTLEAAFSEDGVSDVKPTDERVICVLKSNTPHHT